MEPESWTVVGTGIVILIAIAASNRSLRLELNTRFKYLEANISRLDSDLRRLELEMRERLARLEGLFEGMRESILARYPLAHPSSTTRRFPRLNRRSI